MCASMHLDTGMPVQAWYPQHTRAPLIPIAKGATGGFAAARGAREAFVR